MKNYIVFGILLTLIKHKKCSCSFLAEKFEVSKKTIYRYIAELSASGIPIFCTQGKNGGIEIMEDFDLESNFFTTDEIARINTLLSNCEIKDIDKTTKNVIDKINYTLNKRTKKWGNKNVYDQIIIDNLPWGVDNLYNKKILTLLDSCNRNIIITINYTSRLNVKTLRTVEPYSLILKDGVWYLYAFCQTKKDFRLFKCSRIENIFPTNKNFSRKELNSEKKPWLSNLNINENKIEINLKVKKCALPEILDWASNSTIYSNQQDSVFVKSSVINNSGLINRLLTLGDNIEVISPLSIAQKLLNQCKSISKIYAK